MKFLDLTEERRLREEVILKKREKRRENQRGRRSFERGSFVRRNIYNSDEQLRISFLPVAEISDLTWRW
jgi:hypothetical protein